MKIKLKEDWEDGQKVLIVNGESLDWGLEEESVEIANRSIKNYEDAVSIHSDVMEFFLDSLETVAGFRMNIAQVNLALDEGFTEESESSESESSESESNPDMSGWSSFLDRGLYNLGKLKRFEKCPKST